MRILRSLVVVPALPLALACGDAAKPLQNQPPIAALACPGQGEVGVPFDVDGRDSTDVDGTIASHTLLLDPLAAPVDALHTSFTPTRPGLHTLVLTVVDDTGASAEARCRVPVDGDPIDDGDASGDDDGEASPEDGLEGGVDGSVDPVDGEGAQDDDAPANPDMPGPGVAAVSVRAWTVDCGWLGWGSDPLTGADDAEYVLGFGLFACAHELLAESTLADTSFVVGHAPNGDLRALPGLADAPARTNDWLVVYGARVVPPLGADSVRVDVAGTDTAGVFVRDGTWCEDADDSAFCPIASADAEWWDLDRDVPAQSAHVVDGAFDLEVRVASHDGPATWGVSLTFFADGAPIGGDLTLEAP